MMPIRTSVASCSHLMHTTGKADTQSTTQDNDKATTLGREPGNRIPAYAMVRTMPLSLDTQAARFTRAPR